MIVVIQCAATKRFNAGTLQSERGGKVLFVAQPDRAPPVPGRLFARPDDPAGGGKSWRQALIQYNEREDNPFGLLRAFELYENGIYRTLVSRFGIENTFILSAGWGLIRSDFLTPLYDITFSSAVRGRAPYKLRAKSDHYLDFCQLPEDSDQSIFFFGGKDYVPLFLSLTAKAKGERTIFYNSVAAPRAPGCALERFETRTRTNWHYECAGQFERTSARKGNL